MLGAKKEKKLKKPKKEKKLKKEKPKKEKKLKKEKLKKEKKPKKEKTENSGISKKKVILISVLVIVLLGAVFTVYTLFFKGGSHEETEKSSHTETEQSSHSETEKTSHSTSSEEETTEETAAVEEENPIGELSYANYLRISIGESYESLVALLGEEGKEISFTEVDGLSMKVYNWGESNQITVAVVNNQVVSKSQTWQKTE